MNSGVKRESSESGHMGVHETDGLMALTLAFLEQNLNKLANGEKSQFGESFR